MSAAAGTKSIERTGSSASNTVRSVIKSAGVRALVLPVSAILGIVNTRLIIQHWGTDAFAQYGLLVTIGTLLPFADLGMAAAVMNAVGESNSPKDDPHVRRVITTSVRMLIVSAGVLLAVTGLISLLGLWPGILGDGLIEGSGPIAAALCLGLIAIGLPFGIGQRVLSGLGKNHVSILLLGLQTPIVVTSILVLVELDVGDGSYVPVIPYVSTLLISLAALFFAARMLRPALWPALRDVPKVRAKPGAQVFNVAWPMLIQMIALPIAMQSDRLLLSHMVGEDELGTYNLAAQMYLPIWQVTSAAGFALWPIFARARANGGAGPSPLKLAAGFGGAAAIVGLMISAGSSPLADLASDGSIRLPWDLIIVFAIFMVVQSAKYPLGMYMTDAAGLRYQAKMILLMLPVNLGVSILLTKSLGATGPVLGSLLGVSVFQLAANYRYVKRHRRATAAA